MSVVFFGVLMFLGWIIHLLVSDIIVPVMFHVLPLLVEHPLGVLVGGVAATLFFLNRASRR